MNRHASSPSELAASYLLESIAARDGELYSVLKRLEFIRSGSESESDVVVVPNRLSTADVERLATILGGLVDANALETIQQQYGVGKQRALAAAVEQLRLVATFASSDGGAVSENVLAVQSLVRHGSAEMFAAA